MDRTRVPFIPGRASDLVFTGATRQRTFLFFFKKKLQSKATYGDVFLSESSSETSRVVFGPRWSSSGVEWPTIYFNRGIGVSVLICEDSLGVAPRPICEDSLEVAPRPSDREFFFFFRSISFTSSTGFSFNDFFLSLSLSLDFSFFFVEEDEEECEMALSRLLLLLLLVVSVSSLLDCSILCLMSSSSSRLD
jgi:hypothetical protein